MREDQETCKYHLYFYCSFYFRHLFLFFCIDSELFSWFFYWTPRRTFFLLAQGQSPFSTRITTLLHSSGNISKNFRKMFLFRSFCPNREIYLLGDLLPCTSVHCQGLLKNLPRFWDVEYVDRNLLIHSDTGLVVLPHILYCKVIVHM
jgi:hypothetical protein